MADAVRNPLIVQSGVTTTDDGRWALYVSVRAHVKVPIPSAESEAAGYPVIYEAEPASPPRADPAYPGRRRWARRAAFDPGETG